MGNDSTSSQPRCPAPFEMPAAGVCVMTCPADRKFFRMGGVAGYSCVYGPDTTIAVALQTVAPVVFQGGDIASLTNPFEAAAFSAEKNRVERELAVVYANIDKQKKVNDAFNDLQKAENARDESPEAYQVARTAYYTLVKGPEWVTEEQERIAKAEVDPLIKTYTDTVQTATQRTQDQQKTLDVVQGVKDKVLSLRDDFKYSTNVLSEQIETVKARLAMENRSREPPAAATTTWIDTGLNILLVVVLLVAGWTVYRKLFPAAPVIPTIQMPQFIQPSYWLPPRPQPYGVPSAQPMQGVR